MSVKGLTYRGKLKKTTENNAEGVQLEHATLSYKGPSKMALDTAPHGVFLVGAENRVVEAGSTDNIINLTGHDVRIGDIIRPKVTTNPMQETEIAVGRIIDANSFETDGLTSASWSTGDTFDIMRPITQRLTDNGSNISGPVQIDVLSGGTTTATNILDDQDDPSNVVAMPVKLYGTSAYVVITAEELNVQLSHSSATPDSVQIGDGTNLNSLLPGASAAPTNAAGDHAIRTSDFHVKTILDTIDTVLDAIKVDTGLSATEATLSAMSAKLPASLGIKADAASLSTTMSTEDRVLFNRVVAAVEILDNAISGTEMQVDIVDGGPLATEVTLAALNAKFGSLGQKASAASAPVVLSSEQETILTAIQNAVEIIDNAISGTEMQVDLVDLGGAATETTLSAINAKLPTALGQQNKAGSLSVTLASDQEGINTNLDVVDFLDSGLVDASSTNITVAGLAVVASLAADVKKIIIIDDIGEFMTLHDGTNILAYLPLGGGEIEVSIPSGAALELRSLTGGNITAGNIAINFLG